MVISCSAYSCKNRFVKGYAISFHKFPLKDQNLCEFKPNKFSRICSNHFKIDDFKSQRKRKLTFDKISSGSIFLLKNSKRRSPLIEQNPISSQDSNFLKALVLVFHQSLLQFVRKLYVSIWQGLL